jgi:Ni/Co efflux regulator RcnB
MKSKDSNKVSNAVLIMLMLSICQAGYAERPLWIDEDIYEKHRKIERYSGINRENKRHKVPHRNRQKPVIIDRRFFNDKHKAVIHYFYRNEFNRGSCPPGLLKQRHGCFPSGTGKLWSYGRPLPRNIIFYELPPVLAVNIGMPPTGYRYVRVASDILMIAIGTGIVVDAIHDLGMR